MEATGRAEAAVGSPRMNVLLGEAKVGRRVDVGCSLVKYGFATGASWRGRVENFGDGDAALGRGHMPWYIPPSSPLATTAEVSLAAGGVFAKNAVALEAT